MINKIDGAMLKEMFASGAALLAQNRDNVDALNVFPVPDGDTGTNMTQTITSAINEMNAKYATSVADISNNVARGALKGARGNSGVILSQILRGFSRALVDTEEIDAKTLAKMVRSGATTAYKAVMKPKEGTILTVIRVIAEEVDKAVRHTDDVAELFDVIVTQGDIILRKTPDMLPVLKQAGVVDSGGMGLLIVLRGMYSALTGTPVEVTDDTAKPEGKLPGDYVDDHPMSLEDIKFGYCTEFIVSRPRKNLQESEVLRFRSRLERIGDCVVVVSDMDLIKVHVHTNDPGKAIQYALELGELDSMKIDNMFEEAREREEKRKAEEAAKKKEKKEYAIVAVALGEGLASIFKDLNIDKVVDGGQTMNPSIQDLAQAAQEANAKTVIMLPNNTNIILAAQQAAQLVAEDGIRLIVLPTKSVPMGISAALAFNPDATPEENEEAMIEASMNVHTASITYAVRDTNYDGHEIHCGQIMGMIDNKLEVLGENTETVAAECTAKMVNEDSSLITIYYGADTDEAKAAAFRDELAGIYEDCDVELQMGGQPLYYYLVAVE